MPGLSLHFTEGAVASASEGEGMSKLIPIVLFSLICAALAHRNSDYDPIQGVYLSKERFFYTAMSIGLILFAGLRTAYNDTGTYRQSYEVFISADVELTSGIEWLQIGENPAFTLVQRLMKRWGFSTQSFIMVFSVFTVGTHLWFFRKYSCNLFLTIFLFIMYDAYFFHLAAIKQCTAMAFCLLATDRAINKKYLPFVLFILIACLFHPYALMYLVVPFLFFRPWSKYTFMMLGFFAILGVGLQNMLGSILDVTDMLGESYNANSFNGEGINPFRLLVSSVPLWLSLITMKQIANTEERDQYVIMNLSMLNTEIMFVALFGTGNYFGRLANYFIPFQSLAIPWLVKHFDIDGRRTVTLGIVIFYLLYFIYAMAISSNFNSYYWSVSLWDYLKTLLAGAFV